MSAGAVVTRWTERPKPWHDPDWLREHRLAGLSYRDMAKLAGCNPHTIRDAVNKAGLAGLEAPRQSRPRAARPAVVLPPRPAGSEPVCDPRFCAGWEDCLDDADAPCRWQPI